jgi:endopeptidase La
MIQLYVHDFVIFHTKKKYDEIITILQKINILCDKHNNCHIISTAEKNDVIDKINKIIEISTNIFNKHISLINSNSLTNNDNNDNNDNDNNNNNNNNNNELYLILNDDIKNYIAFNIDNINDDIYRYILKNKILCDLVDNFFNYDIVMEMLMNIVKQYGCLKLLNILQIINSSFLFDKNTSLILNTLDIYFFPLNLTIEQINENIYSSIDVYNIDFSIEYNDNCTYDILIDNYYKIIVYYFNTENTHISKKILCTVNGYFINSYFQISKEINECIYNKNNVISNLLSTKKYNFIPNEYKKLYIKYLKLDKILSFNKKTFNEHFIYEYDIYNKYYNNHTLKAVFNDFIEGSLKRKYLIIKTLLILNDEQTYNAGVLFNLIKDKKYDIKIISLSIYNNLHFELQLKLEHLSHAIKNEIVNFNSLSLDDVNVKEQIIVHPNIPDNVKKIAINKIEDIKNNNSDSTKYHDFVKVILNYPWKPINDLHDDIFTMYPNNMKKWKEIMIDTTAKLNNTVYGHTECKNTIIELLGKWFSNPKSIGKAIGLQGPPGVGKTLIAKSLGVSLNIPFTQVNLGGRDDSSILIGHSLTYSDATYGLIIANMLEAGKQRCIMFFDELDKTTYKHGRNEIFDVLIHVIDQTTNNQFSDNFFQNIKFPIDNVLFVFSFNDQSKIDKILLDRMEIIKVGAYSHIDKVNISQQFLINSISKDIGLSNVSINKDALLFLIDNYTYEGGVRDLKRKLEKIMLKINKDIIYNNLKKNYTKKITITQKDILHHLNEPTLLIKKIHTSNEIGIVNGLYATSYGIGGIIPILVYNNTFGNKFQIKLTGNHKKVMKESISFSLTIATNFIKPSYLNDFFKKNKYGFHIHTPDASTPKDGPSAGSAFTLAFISKILDKKIKNTIALTGEIDINGTITAIGGLDNKLYGAKKAGVKFVLIPFENKSDVDKIVKIDTKLFDEHFKYMLVHNIYDVVNYSLIDTDNNTDNDNDNDLDITYKKTFCHSKYLL